jgi:putative transcriptional regulator
MLFFKRKWQGASLKASSVQPVHKSDGYLQGQLLVSTPLITASCFHKSVIYLFAHNHEGAMGVIINQPLEMVHYSALLEEEVVQEAGQDEVSVYYGGPVDRSRGFVVHSLDYETENALHTGQGVAISANTAILRDMVAGRGPGQALLTVGYAGWTAGQLEQEIEENSWITVPASPELIFDIEDDMKWSMASRSLGIDMNFFSHTVGHA